MTSNILVSEWIGCLMPHYNKRYFSYTIEGT